MSILVEEFIKNPKAFVYLEKLALREEEKDKLRDLLTLIYHQQLLNRLLAELTEENKRLFFEKHLTGENTEAVSFLKEKINGIEKVVEGAVKEIDEKIMNDFEDIKKETRDV